MKKLGLLIKEEAERILKERLEGSDSLLLVGYSGLSASDLNVLRNSLSEVDSSLIVIKNSVGKRILETHQDLQSRIAGPCGLIFVRRDLISTIRVVYEFIKKNANLEVKVGFLKDRIITEDEARKIAEQGIIPLPSLEPEEPIEPEEPEEEHLHIEEMQDKHYNLIEKLSELEKQRIEEERRLGEKALEEGLAA